MRNSSLVSTFNETKKKKKNENPISIFLFSRFDFNAAHET